MDFIYESHRNAYELLEKNDDLKDDWNTVKQIIAEISDSRLIDYFNTHSAGKNKSLSVTINGILKEEFCKKNWCAESLIFQDPDYKGDKWRLDFAKNKIAIEVAFNHGEATAWNLIKPNLSGELNHVQKAIQTEIGILITATNGLKQSCGFDSAVGSYEKFLSYLKPMRHMLTVPMLIIGLEKPKTFHIQQSIVNGKKRGAIAKF